MTIVVPVLRQAGGGVGNGQHERWGWASAHVDCLPGKRQPEGNVAERLRRIAGRLLLCRDHERLPGNSASHLQSVRLATTLVLAGDTIPPGVKRQVPAHCVAVVSFGTRSDHGARLWLRADVLRLGRRRAGLRDDLGLSGSLPFDHWRGWRVGRTAGQKQNCNAHCEPAMTSSEQHSLAPRGQALCGLSGNNGSEFVLFPRGALVPPGCAKALAAQ